MNNGEQPAFPYNGTALGLTKREYFAARAMQGLLTGYSYAGMTEHFNPEKINQIAIRFADELLKTLEQ